MDWSDGLSATRRNLRCGWTAYFIVRDDPGVDWNNFSEFKTVLYTPHPRGAPTNSQARKTAAAGDLLTFFAMGYPFIARTSFSAIQLFSATARTKRLAMNPATRSPAMI